jgi:hypothetical protein
MAKGKRKKLKRRGMPGRKVAIVGKGEGRGLAPRAPYPGVDVWGTNNLGLQQPVDIIWDMHDMDWTLEENFENYVHLSQTLSREERMIRANRRHLAFQATKDFAVKHEIPVMSLKRYEGVPGMVYPKDAIIKKFDCDMFPCVVPYMIAYAIYKRYTQIDLYGINMDSGEEWAYQREAVTGWLMFAKGKGIKVTVTGNSNRPFRIMSRLLYGYNEPQPNRGVRTGDKWKQLIDQDDPDNLSEDNLRTEEFPDVWKES